MADKKQRLVYSVLEFLQTSMNDGSIKDDDKEGMEVAIQCIGEAFSVDLNDDAQKSQLSIAPANLQQIFDVYLKTEAKRAPAKPAASTSAKASPSKPSAPSAADQAAAEKLKSEGNALMTKRDYPAAIAKYTEAITKNGTSPVYYSNRAAAHSQAGDHLKAIDDANKAKELDENFAKAYSRLGHAYFSLGRYSEAVTAYEKGVELDPNNAAMKGSLTTAKAKAAEGDDVEEEETAAASTRGAAANPFAGLGGLGGAGGMPDLASMMNNPQMMAMAQSMMANGGLERLMSNPAIRGMADRLQGGGGMPSMAEMMNDPSIRQIAEQFGRGSGAGSNAGNNSDMYS